MYLTVCLCSNEGHLCLFIVLQSLLNSLEREQRLQTTLPKQMKTWDDSKKKEKLMLERGDSVTVKQKKNSPQPAEEQGKGGGGRGGGREKGIMIEREGI